MSSVEVLTEELEFRRVLDRDQIIGCIGSALVAQVADVVLLVERLLHDPLPTTPTDPIPIWHEASRI